MFMEILKGVELFGGLGNECNTYLIDGEILIDTGTGKFFHEIKKEIESKYEIKKIKRIINTHCHFDHTGGNKKFRDWLKAEIFIHSRDKHSIETGTHTMSELFDEMAKTVTADHVLKTGSIIKTTNFKFEVIPTPGHTPGSVCLYENDKKILVSGDTIFNDAVGRTDLPGGSKYELLESLKKLFPYHINYLLPGHGPPKKDGVSFMIKQLFYALERTEKI
jgi:glyoxylase-like metal-dependent hydrolase (beta-lactamase superfamily II)